MVDIEHLIRLEMRAIRILCAGDIVGIPRLGWSTLRNRLGIEDGEFSALIAFSESMGRLALTNVRTTIEFNHFFWSNIRHDLPS